MHDEEWMAAIMDFMSSGNRETLRNGLAPSIKLGLQNDFHYRLPQTTGLGMAEHGGCEKVDHGSTHCDL